MFTKAIAKRKEQGFSLVELMIVVSIIGILAALAGPRFKTFQAKARQAEAKTSLGHIYTLEQSYFSDNDTYGDETQIGFAVQGNSRYVYTVTGASATDFLGNAVEDSEKVFACAGSTDTWTIDELKVLTNSVPGTSC